MNLGWGVLGWVIAQGAEGLQIPIILQKHYVNNFSVH